jgi:glycosyltransferase involved in cell wall biosynthesis
MVIAVNTRLLLKDRLEGIGWFMHENLRRITASHPEHTFVFLFDRPFSPEFIYSDNIRPVHVPPPSRHPVLWYLWFEHSIPRIIKKYGAGLYISPDGYMPQHLRIPCHITIHDINFHHRPEDLPWFTRIYYQRYFPRFAYYSARIATVSEHSKNDIVDSYGIHPDKIDVVYNGVNEIYSPLSPGDLERCRSSYTGSKPYFVFVGAMHPRKNLTNLLKGFDIFRTRINLDYNLVIVGEKMFMTGEIEKTFKGMKHREDVIFTGRLSPANLRDVMGASAGLTFVPFFEGFGIPLLEAMQCQIPILASHATSLPEIAADAAVYADPNDPNEIANGMVQLATDAKLRSRLIYAGKERVKAFSWDKTSNLYWESICRVIDQC